MKKIITLVLLPLVLLAAVGCQKFVEGYDVSPNSPSEVTPGLLLSAAEVATFSTIAGNTARTPLSWIQQTNGCLFQSNDYGNYRFFENDSENEWNTIYQNSLMSLETIITDSKYATGNPYYVGIAQVLKAYNLGIATDLWGDVPNSEALKGLLGEAHFNPAYDAQADVIASIQTLLTDAIANLSKAPTDNAIRPASDDFIFGGDVANWKNMAWILKARYANRLSKINATTSADDALSFLSNVDPAAADAMAQFDPTSGPNQWYAFEAERAGYVRVSKFFTDLLQSKSDPRLTYFVAANGNGNYNGAPVGSGDADSSFVGSYLAGTASTPLPMVTYVEAKFIEAEANFRKGNLAAAATAHNAAVLASVLQVTGAAAPAAFETAEASETDATITLEKIMTHKYIALFGQVEAYSDWRRTNIPALTPNPNGAISSIPRRYPTPLGERVNNSNSKPVQDLTQRVWWDAN